MGSKDLGLTILQHMLDGTSPPHRVVGVLCPDDDADGRSQLPAFQALATSRGLECGVVATARRAEAILTGWEADLVIVAGWYYFIELSKFKNARFFGFHGSPLPRYRGNAPLVWQIIRGEREVGMSFFALTPGMDEGDIVAQGRIPLGDNDTIGDVLDAVGALSADLLDRHLPSLLDGTAVLNSQDHSRATYCGLRTPEDGRIDWSWPAARLHNFARAQTRPYPGAFAHLPDGRRVRIWRTALDPRPYHGVPGGVAERAAGVVVVTCGEGAVRILDAQVDGEPPAPVETIFNSLRMRLST